ncbi:MAG: YraN family protein [Chitinophagales bacterium]
MSRHNDLGKTGEEKAAEYLAAKGYGILERNYRSGRAEIDIVAAFGNIIVFTEVKTRTNYKFGLPEESVSRSKQKLVIRAAGNYMCDNNIEKEVRFDIISVFRSNNNTWEISHFEDAFFIYD